MMHVMNTVNNAIIRLVVTPVFKTVVEIFSIKLATRREGGRTLRVGYRQVSIEPKRSRLQALGLHMLRKR